MGILSVKRAREYTATAPPHEKHAFSEPSLGWAPGAGDQRHRHQSPAAAPSPLRAGRRPVVRSEERRVGKGRRCGWASENVQDERRKADGYDDTSGAGAREVART